MIGFSPPVCESWKVEEMGRDPAGNIGDEPVGTMGVEAVTGERLPIESSSSPSPIDEEE